MALGAEVLLDAASPLSIPALSGLPRPQPEPWQTPQGPPGVPSLTQAPRQAALYLWGPAPPSKTPYFDVLPVLPCRSLIAYQSFEIAAWAVSAHSAPRSTTRAVLLVDGVCSGTSLGSPVTSKSRADPQLVFKAILSHDTEL